MGLLDGKTAIVTGAARGIGKAIALSLLPKAQTSHLLTLSLTKMQKIQQRNLKQWA